MEESVEYLQKLGLSQYESKTLVVLLSTREANAKHICEFSGIPHTKVYQVLGRLGDKGLVDCTMGKPRKYRAAKPGSVLNKLIRKKMRGIEMLEKEKARQLEMIRELDFNFEAPKQLAHVHPVLTGRHWL